MLRHQSQGLDIGLLSRDEVALGVEFLADPQPTVSDTQARLGLPCQGRRALGIDLQRPLQNLQSMLVIVSEGSRARAVQELCDERRTVESLGVGVRGVPLVGALGLSHRLGVLTVGDQPRDVAADLGRRVGAPAGAQC